MTPYLWTKDNPHAPRRANGMRFWGYPTRAGGVRPRVIGVHTAETNPSPASAENVSRWLRDGATQPASYHRIVDSDSEVLLLPDTAVAFHIRNFNTPSLGLSFATRAHLWGTYPVWDMQALRRGAVIAADWCKRYSIPVRWLTKAEAEGGARGFVRHSVMDPSRRSDPGAKFPANLWFQMIREEIEDEVDPATKRKIEEIHHELTKGRDAPSGGSSQTTMRTRVFQTNAGVGRLERRPPSPTAAQLAAEIVKRLPVNGQVDVDALAKAVVDEFIRRAS